MRIRKVNERDIDELDQFFRACMTDLVTRENKELNLVVQEVDRLNGTVKECLTNSETSFFIAELNGRLVGTIGLNKPCPVIAENIKTESNVFEIVCVYVHPDFQQQGIGKFLFQYIKKELIRRGQSTFYLDAGFSSSQQYWLQRLGKPTIILKDYWGTGEDHLIWKRSVKGNADDKEI